MMVLGVPTEVKAFFAKPVHAFAKPIRGALAAMVLAFLLAPHRRCLKTVAGMVLGHRCHVATISRRLVNPQWKTRDWYTSLYEGFQQEIDRWERRRAKGRRRQWIVAIDTTYHATMSEQMENLIVMSRRLYPETKWLPGRGIGRGRSLPRWNSRWTAKSTSSPVGVMPTICESRRRSDGIWSQRAVRRSPDWETV